MLYIGRYISCYSYSIFRHNRKQTSPIMGEIILEKHLNLFHTPSRILIAGTTNSGKSCLVSNLIDKYQHLFDQIIISGVDSFPLKNNLDGKVTIMKNIYDPFSDNIHINKDTLVNTLLIYDDVQYEAMRSQVISSVFTKGRHLKLSVCLILQNILASGCRSRDISLNASHFILLKMRDKNQVQCLARQIFGAEKAKAFGEVYDRYVTTKPYGHILLDLSVNKPDILTVRTGIDTTEGEMVITF